MLYWITVGCWVQMEPYILCPKKKSLHHILPTKVPVWRWVNAEPSLQPLTTRTLVNGVVVWVFSMERSWKLVFLWQWQVRTNVSFRYHTYFLTSTSKSIQKTGNRHHFPPLTQSHSFPSIHQENSLYGKITISYYCKI